MMNLSVRLLVTLALSASLPALADLDDERDLGGPPKTPPKKDSPKSPSGTNLGMPAPPPPQQKPDALPPKIDLKKPTDKKPSRSPAKTNEQHDSKQPINWSAKGLKASKDTKVVDLLKDVVVTQGNVKMTADRARIYLDDRDEVTKVEAFGNVKVEKNADLRQDKMSARGNEAVFDNLKRTVVLTGRATLRRGGDVTNSRQISYNLDTGWISSDNVEGVVQPGDETLNESKSKPK